MDPTHHEKIVDKLMQYRGKIPKHHQLADKIAMFHSEDLRNQIDELIQLIDWYAQQDEKGLIK